MTTQDDTQPKAPKGLKEAVAAQQATPPDETSPRQPTQPFEVMSAHPPATIAWGNVLMMGGVLVLSACLCATIITLSGVAGIRDEWYAVSTDARTTRVARVETQYALGVQDLAAGRYELAEIRLADVEDLMPGYQDSEQLLAQARQALAATATPTATMVPPTPTPEPSLLPDAAATTDEPPDEGEIDPAELFGQAETAMNIGDYEAAIEWFDALVLAAPTYRRNEVQDLRLQAYLALGRIFLRSQNPDGEDRLAQGVQLVNRASEFGTVPGELLYEADFVARYLAATAYLDGGAYAQAREVLIRLCEEDCDWSHQGESIRGLLQQAGG